MEKSQMAVVRPNLPRDLLGLRFFRLFFRIPFLQELHSQLNLLRNQKLQTLHTRFLQGLHNQNLCCDTEN